MKVKRLEMLLDATENNWDNQRLIEEIQKGIENNTYVRVIFAELEDAQDIRPVPPMPFNQD